MGKEIPCNMNCWSAAVHRPAHVQMQITAFNCFLHNLPFLLLLPLLHLLLTFLISYLIFEVFFFFLTWFLRTSVGELNLMVSPPLLVSCANIVLMQAEIITWQLSCNSKTLNMACHKPEFFFQNGAINPRSPVTPNAKVSFEFYILTKKWDNNIK